MGDCSVAVENCALLGEDEDGDVDELGNDGIGPALLAGELEGLVLGSWLRLVERDEWIEIGSSINWELGGSRMWIVVVVVKVEREGYCC
jgi:hypothetical protein